MAPAEQRSLGEWRQQRYLKHRTVVGPLSGRDDDIGGRRREKEDDDRIKPRAFKKEDDGERKPLSPAILNVVCPPNNSSNISTAVVPTATAPQVLQLLWKTPSALPTPTPSSNPLSPPSSSMNQSSLVKTPGVAALPSNNKMTPAGFEPPVAIEKVDTTPTPLPAGNERTNTSTTANKTVIYLGPPVFRYPQPALASVTPGQSQSLPEQPVARPVSLSSTTTHLLIALASVGGLVLCLAVGYFTYRMKQRKRPFGRFTHNMEFGKGGARGWYGWRSKSRNFAFPQYTTGYDLDQKFNPARESEKFYSPDSLQQPIAKRENAFAPLRPDSQQLEQKVLSDSQQSQAYPPAELESGPSAAQAFLNTRRQNDLTRGLSSASSAYSDSGSQYIPGGILSSYYPENHSTELPNSGDYDQNQKELYRISFLSSLSSGFGDGLLVSESTVNGGASRQTYRQSRNLKNPDARFSWVASVAQSPTVKGNRDTIYTTTSQDPAPRFRSVNSWVTHETTRAGMQQQIDREIPTMPPIPYNLRSPHGSDCSRAPSEDPAFRYHPGSEIPIGAGSRVPSSVLNTKT